MNPIRYILGYGIVIIFLTLINVGGFVAIVYILQNDALGPLKYHMCAGIYFFSMVINSVFLACLINLGEQK